MEINTNSYDKALKKFERDKKKADKSFKKLKEINKNLGFPIVVIPDEEYETGSNTTEISDDMKSVGLIVDTLCDILSEKLGFDVKAELEKRIDEVETED